ncbi:hypothetical protein GA0070624_5038 [Micromonospora rhizosphaerae]|uniref:Uncharacterized protein n=1 Tax=Micromonospora rhizosphaerae TaxID=568872 RepID=A0A1C6SZ61_9ACTN|nr:hypothetical protein [Micromonospora rhizosphaerae]SCL34612.1 hypothetical protein GA0070624_5038 [Micromonospora rhizosphaerae]
MWVALLILLSTYFALNQVGVADSGAALWAPTAAALLAVLLLWRAARNSGTPVSEPVRRSKLARRVLALVVLTYLSMSLVAGLVGGFVPVVPPGGSPDHAIAINLRLGTIVGLPISLILIFGVGRLSATWLAVARPFRWLAMISVIPALVSLALHPVAVAWSRNHGSTPPRDLAEIAPRMVAVTVLIFCALALGNLSGRESSRRPASAESPGDGTGLGGVDSGEVIAPNRTTP